MKVDALIYVCHIYYLFLKLANSCSKQQTASRLFMFHQLFFIYRFKRIFHYKPSILGYPHLLNSPYIFIFFPALWSCLAAEFYGLFISISLMRHKHHSLTTAIALSNAFNAFLPTLSCMHDLLAVFKPDSIIITNMRVCPRLGCAPSLVWLGKCWWFSGIGVISIYSNCLTNLCSSGLKWKVRARCFCSSCFAMKTLGNLKDILQPGRRCQKLKTIVNYETWRNGHGDMYKQL